MTKIVEYRKHDRSLPFNFGEQFLGIFCVPFDKEEGYCFILYIYYIVRNICKSIT